MYGGTPNPVMGMPGNVSVALNWPAGGAGWVVQTTPALGSTNSWTIVGTDITNNGTTASLAFPIPGPSALFRLWNPSIQSP